MANVHILNRQLLATNIRRKAWTEFNIDQNVPPQANVTELRTRQVGFEQMSSWNYIKNRLSVFDLSDSCAVVCQIHTNRTVRKYLCLRKWNLTRKEAICLVLQNRLYNSNYKSKFKTSKSRSCHGIYLPPTLIWTLVGQRLICQSKYGHAVPTLGPQLALSECIIRVKGWIALRNVYILFLALCRFFRERCLPILLCRFSTSGMDPKLLAEGDATMEQLSLSTSVWGWLPTWPGNSDFPNGLDTQACRRKLPYELIKPRQMKASNVLLHPISLQKKNNLNHILKSMDSKICIIRKLET